MVGTVKTLRAVQWTLLASIFVYAALGQVLDLRTRSVDPSISYVFTTAAVALVGIIFVVRRTMVFRSAENLSANPDDAVTLRHWKSGYMASYTLCELLALFGFILRCMGCSFAQSLPFYIGGFTLLFFFGPRVPVST